MREAMLLFLATLAGSAQPAGTRPMQDLTLTAGGTLVVDYASDVARISTSNPEVVDAVAVSTREVLLNAKSPGAATVIVWPKGGTRTQYAIAVEPNLDPVRALIRGTFPDADIHVQAAKDSLSLTGTVPTAAAGERAAALMAPFAKVVVNNLRVFAPAPEKQILLRVKIAELNRNVSTQLAFNLVPTGAGNTIGAVGTGQFPSIHATDLKAPSEGSSAKFTISDVLNVYAFRPDLNLAMFIKALQSRGVLQILAEPNLVAANGKEASFLAGGEFPIPVAQNGANAGAISVIFREYGIRLSFLPQVTTHGTIRMHVKPEVSTIDAANGVTVSGINIPALTTRRMETDIELGEGQSFAIGGLIDDRVIENLSQIPGLAHIPLLGALFRSRSETKSKTELIVLVTPETALPSAAPPVGPAMPRSFLPPAPPRQP